MLVVELGTIVTLFVLAVLLTYETPRTWLLSTTRTVVGRYAHPEHTPEWELEQAELWLMARRKQLSDDLRRIERLLVTDTAMSATRQLGNRLAHQQLRASLARIPDVVPGRDRYAWPVEGRPYAEPAPAFQRSAGFVEPASLRSGPNRPGGAVVEVLDIGGWR